MTLIRRPAVAGTFYPSDPGRLAEAVDELVDAGHPADGPSPKALIVPHAGYVYSGPVAATAYARLRPLRHTVRRVVLLGPAHFAPVDGLAVPAADGLATPLGLVEVDAEAREAVLALPHVAVDDAAHMAEHSLEVQLPFLQRLLDTFRALPILVGRAASDTVADVLDAVWGGSETLVIASSDLSHYHEHETAGALDRATAEAIVSGNGASVPTRRAAAPPSGACWPPPPGARCASCCSTCARRETLPVGTTEWSATAPSPYTSDQ